MRICTNELTSELFLQLYRSAGWEAPCKAQVDAALRHTTATFCAYDGARAVGMVRLIGDGGMSFYLKDFAVLPEYRGKGVGSGLIQAVEQYIQSRLQPGWAVSLELISTPGAVRFYERKGFEQRPNDWDGPGMFKMLYAAAEEGSVCP